MIRKTQLAVVLATGLLVAACSDSGSPVEPAASRPVVASATVSVGGAVVNGQLVPRGHGEGLPTRFEATLHDQQGRPLPGARVRLRYERPQGHGQHHRGELSLYDDGTHGDHTPGDGVYCYEDGEGRYGCHGSGAWPGPHHYEFCGLAANGSESSPVTVTVTVGG